MPTYECNEHQFVENLRRLIEAHLKVIVNRTLIHYDDGRYSLSFIPEEEFSKFQSIATRTKVRASVYANKPFLDEYHRTLYVDGDSLSSAKYPHARRLSIPYVRVEYSFSVWGDLYKYSFDGLFHPEIKISKRKIPRTRNRAIARVRKDNEGRTLIHTLSFMMPDAKALQLSLPKSVLVFDVRRMLRG